MDARKQKNIEAALTRRVGMHPARQESLKTFNESMKDWAGTCRVCGETLTGTLTELRAHRHDPQS